MESDNFKKLPLKTPLTILWAFILVTAGLIWLFSYLDSKRKVTIHQKYVSETEHYIAKNQVALHEIFTVIFPNSSCTTYAVSCQASNSAKIQQKILLNTAPWDF